MSNLILNTLILNTLILNTLILKPPCEIKLSDFNWILILKESWRSQTKEATSNIL